MSERVLYVNKTEVKPCRSVLVSRRKQTPSDAMFGR